MKNIITSLVIMVISLAAFGQVPSQKTAISSGRATGAKPVDDAQLQAWKHRNRPATGSSRGIQPFELNYDAVDEFESSNQGGNYQQFIWDLNSNYEEADTNRFGLQWGIVRFDTIIGVDTTGVIAHYPRRSTSITIDSVQIPFTHENTQGTYDTIEVSIYKWQRGAGLQVDTNEQIVNATWYDTLIITNTSLSPSATMLSVLNIKPPHLTLTYPNNRFLVGVHFYGDTANHTFTLLAGYDDRCGAACEAWPSVIDLNSLYRIIAWAKPAGMPAVDLTGINSLGYDCNNNGVVGDPTECEEFPVQNFVFVPFITIDPVLTAGPIIASATTACPGDTVHLSISPVGGTPPYNYTWTPPNDLSTPFSPSTDAILGNTTTVTVRIIDSDVNPDTLTRSVVITVNGITVDAGNDTSINCGETTDVVGVPGGVLTGATFSWNNGVGTLNNPGVGAGCYTITALNSYGCSATDQVCVTIPGVDQVLNFITGLPLNIGCKDTLFTIQNTSKHKTGWSWLWDFGDSSGTSSTVENPSYSYAATDTYNITLNADSAGCTVGAATKTVTINNCAPPDTTGIEESWLSNHVEMYPNPTTGMVTLSFKDIDGKSGEVGVYDVTGKMTIKEQISVAGSAQKVIDLSNLPDGVYFVKVQLGDDVMMRKLNVRR